MNLFELISLHSDYTTDYYVSHAFKFIYILYSDSVHNFHSRLVFPVEIEAWNRLQRLVMSTQTKKPSPSTDNWKSGPVKLVSFFS